MTRQEIVDLAAEIVRQLRVAERAQDAADVAVAIKPLPERQQESRNRRRQQKKQRQQK